MYICINDAIWAYVLTFICIWVHVYITYLPPPYREFPLPAFIRFYFRLLNQLVFPVGFTSSFFLICIPLLLFPLPCKYLLSSFSNFIFSLCFFYLYLYFRIAHRGWGRINRNGTSPHPFKLFVINVFLSSLCLWFCLV